MIRPLLSRTGIVLSTGLLLVSGLGLASGVAWRHDTERAALLQTALPRPRDVRQAGEVSDGFVAIAGSVTPAVVQIQAESAPRSRTGRRTGFHDFFPPTPDGGSVPEIAGGSGFIVSPDGYILTNNHVVEGAERITATLQDRRVFEARVVGRDPTTDVAVLRIDAHSLPTVRLGDSDDARVGEWVLAIGNPGFGDASTLDFTVTGGIISAKGRPLNILRSELGQSTSGNFAIEDFIQTDAVINPGNSGGPLVNLRGEVIGINTAIASTTGYSEGYGFAIPSNLARRVMKDLVEHGTVRRALLGITIGEVSPEDAEVYRLPSISGVLVEDFAADSPARKAGLERGDVIVAVGGTPVERPGQLQRVVAQRQPGEDVQVDVIRYGERRGFRVRLTQAALPSPAPEVAEPTAAEADASLGLDVSDLTATAARQLGFAQASGVVIAHVTPFSPASRKGLAHGDRIVSIDRVPVHTAADVRVALAKAGAGQIVSILVERPGGQTHIANVRLP